MPLNLTLCTLAKHGTANLGRWVILEPLSGDRVIHARENEYPSGVLGTSAGHPLAISRFANEDQARQ